jgi:hypothetical protein
MQRHVENDLLILQYPELSSRGTDSVPSDMALNALVNAVYTYSSKVDAGRAQ